MANETNYKLNSAIAVRYQAPSAATGLTPVMEIYDETSAKDLVNFPNVEMTELGATGRYVGSFTPDAKGEWLVMIHDGTGKGKVVKSFSVGDYSLQAIGETVALNATVAKEATVAKAADLAALAGVAALDATVAKAADLAALQADIDALEVSSPPMVA